MVEAGELGESARAIDKMADDLSRVIGTMRVDARRAAFSKQLAEALDMADREDQVIGVAASAMSQLSADHAMELLLLDGSGTVSCAQPNTRWQAHQAATSPPRPIAWRCAVAAQWGSSAAMRSTPARTCAIGPAAPSPRFVCRSLSWVGPSACCTPRGRRPCRCEPNMRRCWATWARNWARIGTVRSFQRSQIQASTDSLTGLANRGTLEQHLRALSAGASRFAVVMCDLDDFKMLNDTHGHAAGDAALRVFAEALRCTLRESDLVGRWGGGRRGARRGRRVGRGRPGSSFARTPGHAAAVGAGPALHLQLRRRRLEHVAPRRPVDPLGRHRVVPGQGAGPRPGSASPMQPPLASWC